LTDDRPLPAGRVGKAHGLDGSFYVSNPVHELDVGDTVLLGELETTIEQRGGTAERPLIRVSGIGDRDAARALTGRDIQVIGPREELEEDQWYDDDLVGCEVPGLGTVNAVIHGVSCDVLEVGPKKVLVPLIQDAVREVDLEARVIDVDIGFLALDDG
jgi:16S rRNA processing protein RimM